MTRLLIGCLLSLALAASGAQAEGYDDFALGMSAVNRGDSDKAIAYFTSALAAGDLHASLMPLAYLERARAHLDKGDCAKAVADATAALKLKPAYFEAYVLRANADHCANDDAGAVADLNQVITTRPSGDVYRQRAFIRWDVGDFEGAAADFTEASTYFPKWSYGVLWLGLSELRAGTFDAADFAKRADALDLSGWPGPVVRLYQSKMKPDDVLLAVGKGDTAKDNLCEARFYVAEWWLAQKNLDAAKPLLRDAQSGCRRDFVEYFAAAIELGRLK